MQIGCATGSSTAGLLWCMARAAAGSRVPNPRHRHRHARARARACLPRVGKPERGREAHVFDARRAPARTANAHSLNGDAERRSTRARADQAGRSSRIPSIRQDVGFEYKPLRNAIAAVMGDLASSVVKVPREVTFLDELPRNPTGKVLKRELVKRAETP